MDSTTLSIDAGEARQRLRHMKRAADRLGSLSEDDQVLLKAYRELSRGRQLINVNDALKEAGLNIAGIPRLAISRADRQRVFWERGTRYQYDRQQDRFVGAVSGGGTYNYRNRRTRVTDDRQQWSVPDGTFDAGFLRDHQSGLSRLCAMCPYVPIDLRPAGRLGNYFVLFEANWFWSKTGPIVSTDPYLLKQISGPLMAVHAEWDLSPLEAQVLQSQA